MSVDLKELCVEDITLTPPLKRWLGTTYNLAIDDGKFDDDILKTMTLRALREGRLDTDLFETFQKDDDMSGKTATPEKVFGGESRVNVKDESSRYSTKRFEVSHPKLGQMRNFITGEPCTLPSQLDNAKAGCMFKWLAAKSGLGVQLSEAEKALLDETAMTDEWVGKIGSAEFDNVRGSNIKALLDETSPSGGLEVVPIHFDQNVITFPLLSGEIFPRVTVQDVPRGRRIEGASISTPTISWGQGDNVQVGLFDTSSMVAALDSTVFGCSVAIELGRDFLSDAAADVGAILTRLIGERMSEELDDVIINGDGTSQPQGVLNASGLSSVNTDNGASGAPTLNDYTSLLFAIGKQYRNPAMRNAFVSNDTTYQRSRSIRVDPQASTTDQRPVLTSGDTASFQNYMTLGVPHGIQNDIANTTCIFGAWSRYRLYRRAGLEIRFEQGGKELARNNLVLLIARARFAGRVMDANAFATWTDGQT